MIRNFKLYGFVVVLLYFNSAFSELFTAISELEKLLLTEQRIENGLKMYLHAEEQKLNSVKLLYEQYVDFFKKAKTEEFLSSPINAFLLIKRLTTDWEAINQLIENSDNKAHIKNLSNGELIFPNDDDLTGSLEALMRLQDIYLLNTSLLARGEIKGTTSFGGLTAGDCFELGRFAYDLGKFNQSLDWMQETMNRVHEEKIKTARASDILIYMAYCQHFMNDNDVAAKLMEKVLEIDPDNTHAMHSLENFREQKGKVEVHQDDDAIFPVELERTHDIVTSETRRAYEKLCRGESLKTPQEKSQLHCLNTNNNSSYLLLQPVKMEVLNLKPLIVMYYDVLRDWETNVVKALASPRLERAEVINYERGGTNAASFRISKSTWLENWEHYVLENMNQRLEDITGLDTTNAEDLHVINYGIGGHYEPHYDHVKPTDNVSFLEKGNRIATWIYYLSDVSAGGSTVFPTIGVEVKPVKGAAVFWYNVHRNGDGDEDTKHAACPVLVGSKWVANKWFHEHGNEFKRRCSLNPVE